MLHLEFAMRIFPGIRFRVRKNESRQPDERSIGLDDPMEISYWVKFLDTTRDELLAAISAVGTSAEEVRRYLRAKLERATPVSSSSNS
jgi:Protein of unknown function (DUF3606)